MKTKIVLPSVLIIVIVILGGSLIYEVIQRHRAAKGEEQFIIALTVHLHNALAQGDVKLANDKLDSIVTSFSLDYEQTYDHEAETPTFAHILVQAKAIRDEYEVKSNPNK